MPQQESGQELVRKAAACRNSGRIPYLIEFLGYYRLEYEKRHGQGSTAALDPYIARLPQDWVIVNHGPPAGWEFKTDEKTGYMIDEWGVGWTRGRAVSFPLIEGYHRLADYRFPDPNAAGRFDAVKEGIAKARAEGKYVLAMVWFTLYMRLWFLRGFDNLLMDHYLEPEQFTRLRDRVLEFNLEIIRQWHEIGVDGIYFADDWGEQRSLLMNPEDWRRLYADCYRRMFEAAHAGGAQVWMHLCGNVTSIVLDLLEAGLNVLNPIQPRAMDLEQLARDYGGKLAFYGGIDVQQTLPFGTPQQVKDEVRWLCERLGGTGGYFPNNSHTLNAGIPVENVAAMLEALEEFAGVRA